VVGVAEWQRSGTTGTLGKAKLGQTPTKYGPGHAMHLKDFHVMSRRYSRYSAGIVRHGMLRLTVEKGNT
jgi:hypothetical protein